MAGSRTNRVYRSLHKPLQYLGIDRNLFFMIAMIAVGILETFASLLAAVVFLLLAYALCRFVTAYDPAMFRILAKSARYNTRYDAAKQALPRVEVR